MKSATSRVASTCLITYCKFIAVHDKRGAKAHSRAGDRHVFRQETKAKKPQNVVFCFPRIRPQIKDVRARASNKAYVSSGQVKMAIIDTPNLLN
jgi:hypothetical protein